MTSAKTDNNSIGIELELLTSCPGCGSEGLQPLFTAADTLHQLPGWKRAAKTIVGPLLDTKERVLPRNHPPGKVLEVGCDSGRFLVQLADMGWSVQGLEPSPVTADALRSRIELPVQTGTIDSVDFDPGSFDLIAVSRPASAPIRLDLSRVSGARTSGTPLLCPTRSVVAGRASGSGQDFVPGSRRGLE